MKLLVSVPCEPGGNLHADLVEWMFAVSSPDVRLDIVKEKPVVSSRNAVVHRFLASDADVLLSADSDMIPFLDGEDRRGGLDLLAEAIARDDVDVVSGIALKCGRDGPEPVLERFEDATLRRTRLLHEILAAPRGLHEVADGFSGGANLMFTREVAQAFLDKGTFWFEDVFDRDPASATFGRRIMGQDIWFWVKARELGFRTWVDTRVFWGHSKERDLRAEFMRQIAAGDEAERLRRIPRYLAALLGRLWGNEGYSAPPGFVVRCVEEAMAREEGTCVVECGSGLTSVVLGSALKGDRFLALEEDAAWARPAKAYLDGQVRVSPLVRHEGGYDWYPVPDLAGRKVGLVVCDGPRAGNAGGRYGAMPALWPHLAGRFTVLLDDVNRDAEREVMERWCREYGLEARVVPDGARHYAVLKGAKDGA